MSAAAPVAAEQPAVPAIAATVAPSTIAAALGAIRIVRRVEKELRLPTERIAELIPWASPEKRRALDALLAATRRLLKAEAADHAGRDGSAAERAEAERRAAERAVDGATANLRAWVIAQLPRIEDNDRVLKVLRQAEDELKAELIALVEQWDDADPDEVAATQRTLDQVRADIQERRQAVLTEVQSADFRPVEIERTHYDVTIDGKVISLRDQVPGDRPPQQPSEVGAVRTRAKDARARSPFAVAVRDFFQGASATGGAASRRALAQAMLGIRRAAPESYARRFARYGLEAQGGDLVLTDASGAVLAGEAAARALRDSPLLTAVMARALLDPAIERTQVHAAIERRLGRRPDDSAPIADELDDPSDAIVGDAAANEADA